MPAGSPTHGTVPSWRAAPDPAQTAASATHVVVTERRRPRDDQVRLALRVILHLERVGSLEEEFVARIESTQLGMTRVLSTTQGAVSKVLRRLSAVGVLRSERRHVRGRRRRVHAYYLTPRGIALAREYHERFRDLRPPSPPRS